MPTKVYFGRGMFFMLPKVVRSYGFKRVLIVSGWHVRKEAVFMRMREELAKDVKVELHEPKIKRSDYKSIDELTDFLRRNTFDAVVAIGGGTVLDSAKSASILSVHEGVVEDYISAKTRNLSKRGIFFIAIPTTAGTGSEVTPWATIWGDDKKKYSLSSQEFMFPNIAIVDPSLTDSLPPKETAETGIDALCQAIEAYWNIRHNPISDDYALEAVNVVIDNLYAAVNKPSKNARDKMAWGSLVGGLAFSNTQTTICHAVSYPITAYWDVAHGQATSITLPLFTEYIFPVLSKERRERLLRAMKAKDAREAADNIRELMKGIGLKTKLSELGIPKNGIDIIVAEGFDPDRANNAPRIPTTEKLKQMLYIIF